MNLTVIYLIILTVAIYHHKLNIAREFTVSLFSLDLLQHIINLCGIYSKLFHLCHYQPLILIIFDRLI